MYRWCAHITINSYCQFDNNSGSVRVMMWRISFYLNLINCYRASLYYTETSATSLLQGGNSWYAGAATFLPRKHDEYWYIYIASYIPKLLSIIEGCSNNAGIISSIMEWLFQHYSNPLCKQMVREIKHSLISKSH